MANPGPGRTRRELLTDALAATPALLAAGAARAADTNQVRVDPRPTFALSPHLYMQFMEPLGTTDPSVEASWDRDADDWRRDFVALVKDLGPGCLRWGGNLSRYYRWREGVGPVKARPPMRNHDWGGVESNRVGTHELIDFARRVGADPLICVNFLSDGHEQFWRTRDGEVRTAGAEEAADWVSYANDPDHQERRRHGHPEPYRVRLWQVGNETSYGGGFARDESIQHTIEFARAMRARDRSIAIIGWGDGGGRERGLWAGELLRRAGDELDMVAIHMMDQRPRRKPTVLDGLRYQAEPARAWDELMEMSGHIDQRLRELEQVIDDAGSRAAIAVTEGHLTLRPHNVNPILSEWLTGVYHARAMNTYERHGRRVRIATAADFAGARWTVNAVMMQVPRGVSYLMPVGSVMRLFGRHRGRQAIAVPAAPPELDIAASRTDDTIYLHVANTSYGRAVEARFAVDGATVAGGRVLEIAPESPREYVSQDRPDVFAPRERPLPAGADARWRFPAASVSVVELRLR